MISFEDFYSQNIASFLPEMEQKRKKLATLGKRRLKFLNLFITAISTVVSIYLGFYFSSFWVFFGAAFSVLIAMMLFQDQLKAFLLRNDGLKQLESSYKTNIVSKIISFYGNDMKYEPDGKLPVSELKDSHLFNIGLNTKVEIDDVIRGRLNEDELLIANVKTTSVSETDPGRRKNTSSQSFNGLFVRLKKEMDMKAFAIPKAATASGIGGLSAMKLSRDTNMSVEEQKAYNLKALAEGGMRSYSWHQGLTPFQSSLDKYELKDDDSKDYHIYTDEQSNFQKLIDNSKLRSLLSKSFSDQEAVNELSLTGNLQLLDTRMLDKVIRTTFTYAIHSGYIWVLIPGYEDKFELSLDYEISKETVFKNFTDIQLVHVALSPFC